jgi:hypothetical protein
MIFELTNGRINIMTMTTSSTKLARPGISSPMTRLPLHRSHPASGQRSSSRAVGITQFCSATILTPVVRYGFFRNGTLFRAVDYAGAAIHPRNSG